MKIPMFALIFLYLFNYSISYSNQITDIEIGNKVDIYQNSIIYFVEKTNCSICEESLKKYNLIANKLHLKQFLIISGQSLKDSQEFLKRIDINAIAMNDSDYFYSNQFKILEAPSYFVVKFTGEIVKYGRIGDNEIKGDEIMANRKRLPKLNSSYDYFFTQSIDEKILTYDATNNELIIIDSTGQVLKRKKTEGVLEVVRNIFFQDEYIYALYYSSISTGKIVKYDNNLNLVNSTNLKYEDSLFHKNYSLAQDSYLDSNGNILSGMRCFYDSLECNAKVYSINKNNGKIRKVFEYSENTGEENILVKNYPQTAFISAYNPEHLYIYPGFKIQLTEFNERFKIDKGKKVINVFFENNKLYIVYASDSGKYGSQSKRFNYNIAILDVDLKIKKIYLLGNTYNQYHFIFIEKKGKNLFEILGRDDLGMFLETISLIDE
jgi:peroxiredoxin